MRFKKQILSILLLLTFLFTGCQSAVNPAEEGSDVYAIAEIQKYGNLLLSISGTEFMEDGYTCGDIITAEINGTAYDMPIGSNYADVDEGNAVCRIAIDPAEEKDCVILAINMGDLATDSGLAIKTETKEADSNLIGKTKEEISMIHPDWLIHEFSDELLSAEQTIDGICDSHYIIKLKDNTLYVYKRNNLTESVREQEINTSVLTKDDIEELKNGINADTEFEVLQILESFVS